VDMHALRPEVQQWSAGFEAALKAGIEPEAVAAQVFESIRDDTFYIVPAQPGVVSLMELRMQDIIAQRNPTITAGL
ncbi:MAG: hypothetical protein ACRDG3_05830, partial [Tepidiformaceae bacterium]